MLAMTLAEQLIDDIVKEKLVSGKPLSGPEVAELKPKQHVFINGRRAVIIDVSRQGNNVELVYMTGTRMYGPEKYLVVSANTSASPVLAADVEESYKITRGMKRAYEKVGKLVCRKCGMTVPRYPGRYPSRCPDCGGQLEDLQNSPRYSESRRGRKRENADRHAWDAQMRRVPKDRIGRE
jgi:predicted Zn-ribbon and HTH transcriptional regulator